LPVDRNQDKDIVCSSLNKTREVFTIRELRPDENDEIGCLEHSGKILAN
jgi:hypothetical protein